MPPLGNRKSRLKVRPDTWYTVSEDYSAIALSFHLRAPGIAGLVETRYGDVIAYVTVFGD